MRARVEKRSLLGWNKSYADLVYSFPLVLEWKNEQKLFQNKQAMLATSNGHILNIWQFTSFKQIARIKNMF